MPPKSWVRQLPSLAVFTSWQCLCNNWILFNQSLPPNDSGFTWSTSHLSSFLNVSPHSLHFPFCLLSNSVTLLLNSGFLPNLVLQYVRLPSNGLAGPFTFACLTISTRLCLPSSISTFPPILHRNRHVSSSPIDQYFFAIQWFDLLGCLLVAHFHSTFHR